MSFRWEPHGLIQDQRDEEDYQAAKITVDEHGNIIDPKEYRTVLLFKGLFEEVLFPGRNFKVNSQYLPSEKMDVDKACDLAVRFVDSQYKWHILCLVEAKRAGKTGIRDLEDQAELYCEAFLEGHQDQDVIYACTLVGVSVRCWKVTRDSPRLQGLWDADEKGHYEFYKDVGEDANIQLLEHAFEAMKSIPVGPLRIDQDHS
ncbi:hypothetical protein F5884DRAFT_853520 [Xylogone sp. PMI_703]|nr:hypothetical protein F5884DRAFT_853520 [Xylogone sp. PMI_703]